MIRLFLGIIAGFCLLPSFGKPGESYVLTGKEKSIFGIFQADMKAWPDLYAGEDVNECYKAFKAMNDLDGGRKLQLGEELQFPHTEKSKALLEAKAEEEARLAAEAERETRLAAEAEKEAEIAANTNSAPSELFGTDLPSRQDPEVQRQNARHNAVTKFYQESLIRWMMRNDLGILKSGNPEQVVKLADARVDEEFSKAIKLHTYPEKEIYILEFEKPKRVEDYIFFAVKVDENGQQSFFSLEKGLSMFGAGDVSILKQWHTTWDASELGGRPYDDLSGFVKELETIISDGE